MLWEMELNHFVWWKSCLEDLDDLCILSTTGRAACIDQQRQNRVPSGQYWGKNIDYDAPDAPEAKMVGPDASTCDIPCDKKCLPL